MRAVPACAGGLLLSALGRAVRGRSHVPVQGLWQAASSQPSLGSWRSTVLLPSRVSAGAKGSLAEQPGGLRFEVRVRPARGGRVLAQEQRPELPQGVRRGPEEAAWGTKEASQCPAALPIPAAPGRERGYRIAPPPDLDCAGSAVTTGPTAGHRYRTRCGTRPARSRSGRRPGSRRQRWTRPCGGNSDPERIVTLCQEIGTRQRWTRPTPGDADSQRNCEADQENQPKMDAF